MCMVAPTIARKVSGLVFVKKTVLIFFLSFIHAFHQTQEMFNLQSKFQPHEIPLDKMFTGRDATVRSLAGENVLSPSVTYTTSRMEYLNSRATLLTIFYFRIPDAPHLRIKFRFTGLH